MEGYLSDDILAFVGVINITLVDVTIVNNLIPIANQLNATQDNITSILAQSKNISGNQVNLNDLLGSVNSGISFSIYILIGYNNITDSITDLNTTNHKIGDTSYWIKTTAILIF